MSASPHARVTGGSPERVWFLGHLFTFRATGAETGGSLALAEVLAPEGAGAPPDVHSREDEWFLVLEGRVTITVGDGAVTAAAGDFVACPRGVPHAYRVEGPGPARFLGAAQPAGFEGFFRELGVPATSATVPPPQAPPTDPTSLARAAERYGVRMLTPGAEGDGLSGAAPGR